MPLIAKNKEDQYVQAQDCGEKDRHKEYFCPNCEKEMLLVLPKLDMIDHFRHIVSCKYETEPETLQHLAMKQKFLDMFPTAISEHRIGNRITDVYLPDFGIAIECQCSPISYYDLINRTADYTRNGVFVFWIFGSSNYNFSGGGFSNIPNFLFLKDVEKEMSLINFGRVYYMIGSSIFSVHYKAIFKNVNGNWDTTSKRKVKTTHMKYMPIFNFIKFKNKGYLLARLNDDAFWKTGEFLNRKPHIQFNEGVNTTMDVSKHFGSNWLNASDLKGKDLSLTIKSVSVDIVGKKQEEKIVIAFNETEKSLILNKVNFNKIKDAYGSESDAWLGKKIVLYPTLVSYNGEEISAIRIRIDR